MKIVAPAKQIFSFAAIVMFLTLAGFSQSDTVDTESEFKRFEIGGQFTLLRQRSFQEDSRVFDVVSVITGPVLPPSVDHQTEFGFGGRFTYNFNKNVAIEAEANYFPVDRLAPNSRESAEIFGTNDFVRVFVEPRGRKFQVVAGPKIGIRRKKFGVFGKIRPGLFHVERYPVIIEFNTFPALIAADDRRNNILFCGRRSSA